MTTSRSIINTAAANDVSEDTLEKSSARLRAFVRATRDFAINARLGLHGWSPAYAAEAASLLDELQRLGPAPQPLVEHDIGDAYQRCSAFLATDFVAAQALVTLKHPEQAAILFDGLAAGDPVTDVVSVSAFLERVASLEGGAGRKGERKSDREVLAMLVAAGITKETRKALAKATSTALRLGADTTAEAQKRIDDKRAARLEVLRKIYAFHAAWSTVARAVIKDRRGQVLLGIAKRRAPRSAAVAIPDPAPVVAPPVVAPPVVVAAPPAPAAAPSADVSADETHGPASRAA